MPVSVVTGAGALVLLALAGRWDRSGQGAVVSVAKVLRGAPWQIVVFSLGMYLVVYGLRNASLTGHLASALVWLAEHSPRAAAIGTGFGAAILSSVMNNIPSVLIGALSIDQAQTLAPAKRELMTVDFTAGDVLFVPRGHEHCFGRLDGEIDLWRISGRGS